MTALAEHPVPEPEFLSDQDLLDRYRELRREINQLEAASADVLAEIDARNSYAAEDCLSATAWILWATGENPAIARSRVQTARRLRYMPQTSTTFGGGELCESRVRLLVRAYETNAELFARDEELLVEHALCLSSRDLPAAIRYWRNAADPDGSALDHHRMYEARRLWLSAPWDGMGHLDGAFDPEGTATITTALDTRSAPLGKDDTRTATQRRADALVEICAHYLTTADTPRRHGTRPHITVTVSEKALQGEPDRPCELANGGPVPPEVARRIACDATVTPIIVDANGVPLDVGRTRRTIPPAIWRALVLRDGGCTHPGCDRPPDWCQAHHKIHWADGGPTTLENLELQCDPHHHKEHEDDDGYHYPKRQ